jgi:hypothetical protein
MFMVSCFFTYLVRGKWMKNEVSLFLHLLGAWKMDEK